MSPSAFPYLNRSPPTPDEPYTVAEIKAPISTPPPSSIHLIYESTAWFALAMFKLIAIEDVQHAGEGRVVCLHYIPNGPGSVCKNRHDEARIFVT